MILGVTDLESTFLILLKDLLEVMILLSETDFVLDQTKLFILENIKENILLSILTLIELIQHLVEVLDSVAGVE